MIISSFFNLKVEFWESVTFVTIVLTLYRQND